VGLFTIILVSFARNKISVFLFDNVGKSLIFKVKVIPQQAEVVQGVPGRLRPWIFLMFGTTRVVGCQPYAPAAFTPGEIPGTHFQGLSRLRAHGSVGVSHGKKSPVTPPVINMYQENKGPRIEPWGTRVLFPSNLRMWVIWSTISNNNFIYIFLPNKILQVYRMCP